MKITIQRDISVYPITDTGTHELSKKELSLHLFDKMRDYNDMVVRHNKDVELFMNDENNDGSLNWIRTEEDRKHSNNFVPSIVNTIDINREWVISDNDEKLIQDIFLEDLDVSIDDIKYSSSIEYVGDLYIDDDILDETMTEILVRLKEKSKDEELMKMLIVWKNVSFLFELSQ